MDGGWGGRVRRQICRAASRPPPTQEGQPQRPRCSRGVDGAALSDGHVVIGVPTLKAEIRFYL